MYKMIVSEKPRYYTRRQLEDSVFPETADRDLYPEADKTSFDRWCNDMSRNGKLFAYVTKEDFHSVCTIHKAELMLTPKYLDKGRYNDTQWAEDESAIWSFLIRKAAECEQYNSDILTCIIPVFTSFDKGNFEEFSELIGFRTYGIDSTSAVLGRCSAANFSDGYPAYDAVYRLEGKRRITKFGEHVFTMTLSEVGIGGWSGCNPMIIRV